jgi:type II secretory pathway component PulC
MSENNQSLDENTPLTKSKASKSKKVKESDIIIEEEIKKEPPKVEPVVEESKPKKPRPPKSALQMETFKKALEARKKILKSKS